MHLRLVIAALVLFGVAFQAGSLASGSELPRVTRARIAAFHSTVNPPKHHHKGKVPARQCIFVFLCPANHSGHSPRPHRPPAHAG